MKQAVHRLLAVFLLLLVGSAHADLQEQMDDYVAHTKNAANAGDHSAELRIGKAYYFGFMPLKKPNNIIYYYPVEKNDGLAYANLKKAAEAGDYEAASIAGVMAMNGVGTIRDDSQAKLFFEMSAATNLESRFFLSRYYWQSKDINVKKQGYELVKDAEQTDSPELVFALSNYYQAGIGVKKDTKKAENLKLLGAKLAKERDELVQNRVAAFEDNAARKKTYSEAFGEERSRMIALVAIISVVGIAATVAAASNAINLANNSGRHAGGFNPAFMNNTAGTPIRGPGTLYLYGNSGSVRSVPVFFY